MNLTEALDGAPARDDLVVVGGDRFSTSELEAATSSTAAALAERSVGSGDRVAFQLPVSVEAVVLYRACWRLGAVAAALHPRTLRAWPALLLRLGLTHRPHPRA